MSTGSRGLNRTDKLFRVLAYETSEANQYPPPSTTTLYVIKVFIIIPLLFECSTAYGYGRDKSGHSVYFWYTDVILG